MVGQGSPHARHGCAQALGSHCLHGVRAPLCDIGQALLGTDHLAVRSGVHVGVHQGVGEQGGLPRESLGQVEDPVLGPEHVGLGVVRHQADEPLGHTPGPEEHRAIEGVEPGMGDGGGVADIVQGGRRHEQGRLEVVEEHRHSCGHGASRLDVGPAGPHVAEQLTGQCLGLSRVGHMTSGHMTSGHSGANHRRLLVKGHHRNHRGEPGHRQGLTAPPGGTGGRRPWARAHSTEAPAYPRAGHPHAASVTVVNTKDELRQVIIDAAAELFAQHGYEAVGVRQVAQAAGVSQYRVRNETGGRAELFASVMAEKVSSDAASQIAHAVEAPNETPPLAAIVAAGAAVFASPERSWDLLELEALTRSHRDEQLREIETERIQARWDNMRTVVERVRAAGGVDQDVDDAALTHFAVALSAGLALVDPVITDQPQQAAWDSLMARIGIAMAPVDMLLEADHEARSYWRLFIDVPDRPGGVDRFIRAMATLHGYTLALDVVGSHDGIRTLDMRMTAPGSVTEETLLAAALSAGTNAYITRGSPDDALDLTTSLLDGSAELISNPGWAPFAAMRMVSADQVDVVKATKGAKDASDVLRLQWTPERHVLLRRQWAPFTRVEQARASALLRLSAAIAVAAGDPDAQGWVEQVKDGTVWIRLAHPDDADAVTAMHQRCSDRTLYLRYVSPGDWQEIQMRRLTGGHSGATLVATGPDGTVIGLGNVFPERPDDEHSAEIALLVEDAHHGEGIGTALLRSQLRMAERMGFQEVVAVVLADNAAMTRMLERTGLTWSKEYEEGTLTLRAPIQSPR